MARTPRRGSAHPPESPKTTTPEPPSPPPPLRPTRRGVWIGLAAAGLLAAHLALAESSLVRENPTVDEVVHMPAGVTYWQKRTFRLYHHNPPLVKMIAALPVVLSDPLTQPLYQLGSWTSPEPSPTTFSQSFAFVNADRYFELFQLARMVMPLFSVLGGLVVFAWSARMYGAVGGLLSLALWAFCPNVLAHTRLVTTDVGSTVLGAGATYLFWRYLHNPTLARAAVAGVALGLAQLSKFSMLLLYLVWPFLWLARIVLASSLEAWWKRIGRGASHGLLVVALSILTIDAGYLFEGVGRPLGSYEFACQSLTKAPPGGIRSAPATKNLLYATLWPFRQNRFRGTFLERLPSPLPEHYLLGFDEQKIESEGIPERLGRAFRKLGEGDADAARREAASDDAAMSGYPVYLNGELRDTGWWYYYLATLTFKVPEGTWLILIGSMILLLASRRSRECWADEVAVWTVPAVALFAMSALTDINLGLRYVLSIFPYLFIQAGKLVPWVASLSASRRRVVGGLTGACASATVISTLLIHPHYLSYFNALSGGPDRVPARLIDSNLDWGQDLVGLREWCRANTPDQPIGLAYFGQINPNLFEARGDGFKWFLPPIAPGRYQPMPRNPGAPPSPAIGPAPRLEPGYYAVSVSLLYGLRWRQYDPTPAWQQAWEPQWDALNHAFSYFQRFHPIHRIGHSIYIYKLTEQDVARAGSLTEP